MPFAAMEYSSSSSSPQECYQEVADRLRVIIIARSPVRRVPLPDSSMRLSFTKLGIYASLDCKPKILVGQFREFDEG